MMTYVCVAHAALLSSLSYLIAVILKSLVCETLNCRDLSVLLTALQIKLVVASLFSLRVHAAV